MAQQQRQIVTSREASESASRRQILHTPKEAADKIAHLWNSLIRWTAFLPREESGETSQVLLRANSKLRDRCSALHSEVRPIFDQTATRLRTRPNSSRRDVIPTESQQPRRARVIVPRRSGDGVTTSSLGLVHIKDSVSREVPLASKQPVLPTGGNSNRVARTRSWRRLLGFGQAFEGSDGTSVIMPERLETCCVENVDIPTIPFGRFKKLNDGTVIFVTKDCERDKEKRARNTVCEASVEENSEILPADKRRRHEDARAAYQVDSYAENRELAQNIAQLEGDEATVTADNDDNESLYDVEELREMMRDVNGEEWFLIKWLGYPESDNTWEPLENITQFGNHGEEIDRNRAIYDLKLMISKNLDRNPDYEWLPSTPHERDYALELKEFIKKELIIRAKGRPMFYERARRWTRPTVMTTM